MFTVEDKKDIDDCSVRFHFTHRLIKMPKDDKFVEEKLIDARRVDSDALDFLIKKVGQENTTPKVHKNTGPRE